MRTKTAQQVADYVGGTLYGDGSAEIRTVGSLKNARAGALTYAEPSYLDEVPHTQGSCVLVQKNDFPQQTIIVVDSPRIAFARAAQWLLPRVTPPAGVHETAIIEPGATLGANVSIGAWSLIETDVTIGQGTVIYPGCYVGPGSHVGDECLLFPHAVLYPGSQIGNRVTIHSGVVIGADGFGFVYDGDQHVRFPQVGRAIIGSNVDIGANACVDRGALDETIVQDGAKIDNLCQIAHNVKIGEHAIISSQTGIAGSSTVGNHATIGGQVGVADYCRIDAHGLVGAQCGVPSRKRIPAGQVYWGTPARPLKDIKKQQAYLSRLPKIADEVRRLREEIEDLKSRLTKSVNP